MGDYVKQETFVSLFPYKVQNANMLLKQVLSQRGASANDPFGFAKYLESEGLINHAIDFAMMKYKIDPVGNFILFLPSLLGQSVAFRNPEHALMFKLRFN